jgi:hypothetical protein
MTVLRRLLQEIAVEKISVPGAKLHLLVDRLHSL